MIYEDLHNILKEEIDSFVYGSITWIADNSYKELDFSSFFRSEEDAIKFFTSFDFTPLLDELKKANYVENLLKEMCSNSNYFYELINTRVYFNEFKDKTPQEKISILAKKVLMDLLFSVFTTVSLFSRISTPERAQVVL
ncbi:MAG: hypothetical protein RMJ17_01955 [Candidatus Aenigmarchaeota archaeon]|nr:hypothetical protein [Candidatus Aenigmarchaeota archaeon]MDW8149339.1 hypothetical protein [Candidatus Aenigmarchaeota archaeon]